jgi:protein gp37
MNKTKIEWCDYTWNPVTGCLHGCEYCYARRIAERFKGKAFPEGFAPTFYPNRLDEPKKLKKPSRIFVVSMGDLFGGWVSPVWINRILRVAEECPQHTFIFLTKNPTGMRGYNFLDNCWCGTSIENQEATKKRIPELLKVSAPVRLVSIEPMLGPVDLTNFCNKLNWIIIGAQTGPKAVKPKPEDVRSIIDLAQEQGIPLFLKDNLKWPEKIQEFPR